MSTSRRTVLKGLGAAWCAPLHAAFAALPGDRRLVVMILRGGVDGLAAVPPHGDKDYARVRGSIALSRSGPKPLHDLDGMFGLHPSLMTLKQMYDRRELLVFHNICSPYRDRSHFDGQDVLEGGGARPRACADGWLNRALAPMGLRRSIEAVAVDQAPPLLLSGTGRATSWMPASLPLPDAAYLARVKRLYADDTAMGRALEDALALQQAGTAGRPAPPAADNSGFPALCDGAGRLLASSMGPRVAVLDMEGWDTHVDQGADDGALAAQLTALDDGLDRLKKQLAPVWNKTAVIIATEFGRTVRPNGDGGTDHGTGGVSFLLGGAVAGGAVRAEWTGLSDAALRDGRDQPARSDLRSLFKGVLAEHVGVPASALGTRIFPDSDAAPAMRGLIRV